MPPLRTRLATKPWAHSTVRAGKTQKSQNRQYCDKHKLTMRASLPVSQMHRRRPDLARGVSCYRSSVKRPFRSSKLVKESDLVAPAISFVHETPEPLPR